MTKRAVFLFYVALTLWLALHHEPWRDEADSWLMARDATVSQIIAIGPDSGHPPLWYFLLKPLSLSGLPYAAQPALNLIIIWVAAWLLVFRSPFPSLLSGSILFTDFFSFEYSVIARNYALGIMGLFMYLAASDRRVKHPNWLRIAGVFIMSLASFFTLIPAASLFLIEALKSLGNRAKKNRVIFPPNTWLMLACVLVGALSLWPSGRGQFSGRILDHFFSQAPIDAMSTLLMPRQDYSGIYSTLAAGALVATGILTMKLRWQAALFFTLSVLSLLLVFASVFYQVDAPRYAGMLFVYTVSAAWLATSIKKSEPSESHKIRRQLWAMILFFFLAQLPDTISIWVRETISPFTDAPAVANKLIAIGGTRKLVSCLPPTLCESVLLRMPGQTRFLYPGIGFGTHGFWDRQHIKAARMSPDQGLKWTRAFLEKEEITTAGWIFMSQRPLSNPAAEGLREITPTTSEAWGVKDETFYIYSTQD